MIDAYGKCPKCGAACASRERRPNGNDQCVAGHTYPSAQAVPINPIRVIHGNSLAVMPTLGQFTFDMAFVDPPDNIGLEYEGYEDNLLESEYRLLLENLLVRLSNCAPIIWISFNSRWMFAMGSLFDWLLSAWPDWEGYPCTQIFTFGTNKKNWLTNGHRPLWLLHRNDVKFYPDAIHVESWRQQHGDKRAKAGGRIPDDVFDFPRVVGNSKQRRAWHRTQLHEGILERCMRLCTLEGGRILDPMAGTGTTGRVAKRIGRRATLIDQSATYCLNMAGELETDVEQFNGESKATNVSN